MPDVSTVALFLAAGLVLVVVPGPNILYIVARGVHQGRAAGLVSALGVEVGTLIHVAAATLGLSALLASSAEAYLVVKYAGAAYLVYLGVRTLLAKGDEAAVAAPALFFLAFLPQFVDPAKGSVATQTLVFGCLLAALGLGSDVLYALLAGGVGGWLKGSARSRAVERWVTGGVYRGLGVATAVMGADGRR